MRKYIKPNGTFYYPELYVSLVDTEEIKIIVENPAGYVEGDSVRLFYTFSRYNIKVGVNTFEMFSPLVKDGAILRAIFYLPLSIEFTSLNQKLELTDYFIKTKGSTDFDIYEDLLDTNFSYFFLTTMATGVLSHPIPVFFFSERGAGLFENTILNRQSWVADTNFSSVAIRQDKFNPFDMKVGGRNLILNSSFAREYDNWGTIGGGGSHTIATGASDYPSTSSVKRSAKWTNTATAGQGIITSTTGSWSLFENGKEYVITCWVKASSASTFSLQAYGDSGDVVDSFKFFSVNTNWQKIVHIVTGDGQSNPRVRFFGRNNGVTYWVNCPKVEIGNKATDWTPAPEDYEVTEVVTGADLAGGLAKFNSSYAFKFLDDSEWVTKKLICPEDYIQLFWGEPRSETRFSFWFKIKEIEKSSEAWGEVEHYRELRAGTDVKERRKEVTKYRFPKTKLRLTSGVFRQDIIDKLKGIAHSPTIYKYNPYTKLNEGRGVIAQVTELRDINGMPIIQLGTGHFKLLDYTDSYSNTIEELINSPESVFDLELSVKGQLFFILFLQNRDDLSSFVLISSVIIEPNFTKKTFNSSITIDRSKKVKPALIFSFPSWASTEIKDIYIKGSLGGIEDVEVEIATMNIIPHQDGESEMELTVISDDFRKPDYLYF